MWNRQPTREVITKESIRLDLIRRNRASMPITVMMVLAAIVFLAILLAGGISSFPSKQQFAGETFPLGRLLLSIVCFVLTIPVVVYPVLMVIAEFSYAKDLRAGNFTIEEDELVNMVREEPHRNPGSRHTQYQNVFYFWKTGRYVVSGVDGSAFEYSSVGDTFYVVLMGDTRNKSKKGTPLRIYSTKIYRYEERP